MCSCFNDNLLFLEKNIKNGKYKMSSLTILILIFPGFRQYMKFLLEGPINNHKSTQTEPVTKWPTRSKTLTAH